MGHAIVPHKRTLPLDESTFQDNWILIANLAPVATTSFLSVASGKEGEPCDKATCRRGNADYPPPQSPTVTFSWRPGAYLPFSRRPSPASGIDPPLLILCSGG